MALLSKEQEMYHKKIKSKNKHSDKTSDTL